VAKRNTSLRFTGRNTEQHLTITTPDGVANLGHLRVLVIDDNWFARRLIKNVLQAFGIWNVTETKCAVEGLGLLREHTFDLVLVDDRMPALSGTQFTKQVRAGSACASANIPIIVVSAHTDEPRVLKAVAAGAQGYLAKPFTAKRLYQRILSVIDTSNDNNPVSRAA